MLRERGVELLAAPVSGNAKVHQGRPAVVRVLGAAGTRSTPRLPYLQDDRARPQATSAKASSRAS